MTEKVVQFQAKMATKRTADRLWTLQREREGQKHQIVRDTICELIERGYTEQEIARTLSFFADELIAEI